LSAPSISLMTQGCAPWVKSPVAESRCGAPGFRESKVGALYSSRLSHVPQSGHLPIHLGWTEPQELHRNCSLDFDLAMASGGSDSTEMTLVRTPTYRRQRRVWRARTSATHLAREGG